MAEGPDERTLSDIRRWYQDHGIAYEREDWGQRDENGESAGSQRQQPERSGTERVNSQDPTAQWWWEKQAPPWAQRGDTERGWAWQLEDFFAPYLSMMPRQKGNLLRQVINDGKTYAEIGAESKVTRQAAHAAVQRAMRDLTKLIARDHPGWTYPADGRARDFDRETEAAEQVFEMYMKGL